MRHRVAAICSCLKSILPPASGGIGSLCPVAYHSVNGKICCCAVMQLLLSLVSRCVVQYMQLWSILYVQWKKIFFCTEKKEKYRFPRNNIKWETTGSQSGFHWTSLRTDVCVLSDYLQIVTLVWRDYFAKANDIVS